MNTRWTHSNKAIYNLGYHLVWCPKYRRNILNGKIKDRLIELFIKKSKEIDTTIEDMQINGDHVHLFVKSSPVNSPHFIVQHLKGMSSNILRKEFPELLKMPSLWTRSYYCESVGFVSEKTIKQYVQNQKNK
jgi:putative transposase